MSESPPLSPSALQLTPHPARPCPQVHAVEAELRWQGAELLLRYRIHARLAALCVPAPKPPAPAEGLWRHLCLEAFIGAEEGAGEGEDRYHEFNFSPSGCWAAFAFSGPRVRDAACPTLAVQPRVRVEQTEDALTLAAALPRTALPPLRRAPAWRVGLAAVIALRQDAPDAALGYWALAHPARQPDFHHPAGWTLRLPPPPAP